MNNREETSYNGYRRIDFTLDNYVGSVIVPIKKAINNPWIWRAEFLGDFEKADMELVKRGWHLAYYKISDMYGCPEAIELMKRFHDYIVKEFKLHNEASIFGFSRGGLYAVNYAVKYPNKVSSLYLDAPVIDLQSWPKSKSSIKNWKDCLACYGFNEVEAKDYSLTQLDRARILAENKIPVLVVVGDSDPTVPYEENAKPFIKEYLKTHNDIQVIIKKGCTHHPHSLEDITLIVEFITKNL